MSDPPSTENDSGRPPEQPWQRFTLLDALLLQAAFAVGLSVVSLAIWSPQTELRAIDVVLWIAGGAGIGVVVGGPLVLGVQVIFRGRRTLPSGGEGLWLVLSGTAGFAFVIALVLLRDLAVAVGVTLALVAVLIAISLPVAIQVSTLHRHGAWRTADCCPWTDVAGRAIFLGVGAVEWLIVAMMLVRSALW